MVDQQIAGRGVSDAGVLAAMREVPREAFVPEALKGRAYDDGPLPIEAGQTISQPYVVALMIEAAGIDGADRVLEIGAGIGNLTRQLAPRRKQYIATDLDEEHLARLRTRFSHRPNLKIARCDLTNPADFEQFHELVDTVVCLNVVEHVEDDLIGLQNIRSALQPGGRAIILVPQGQSIYGSLDVVLGHYRRYSEDELQTKLEKIGFRVETIIRFNRVTRPGWYINGRILRKRTFGRFQLYVFDRLVWLWRKIDRFLPWNPVSLIAIAVKE